MLVRLFVPLRWVLLCRSVIIEIFSFTFFAQKRKRQRIQRKIDKFPVSSSTFSYLRKLLNVSLSIRFYFTTHEKYGIYDLSPCTFTFFCQNFPSYFFNIHKTFFVFLLYYLIAFVNFINFSLIHLLFYSSSSPDSVETIVKNYRCKLYSELSVC